MVEQYEVPIEAQLIWEKVESCKADYELLKLKLESAEKIAELRFLEFWEACYKHNNFNSAQKKMSWTYDEKKQLIYHDPERKNVIEKLGDLKDSFEDMIRRMGGMNGGN